MPQDRFDEHAGKIVMALTQQLPAALRFLLASQDDPHVTEELQKKSKAVIDALAAGLRDAAQEGAASK